MSLTSSQQSADQAGCMTMTEQYQMIVLLKADNHAPQVAMDKISKV
jgi:hypothetical protein